MRAAFYQPVGPQASSGRILHTVLVSNPADLDLQAHPYVVMDDDADAALIAIHHTLAASHHVIDGKIVPRPSPEVEAEQIAEAWRALRLERDQRLKHEVDDVICNPLRWAEFSAEDQARFAAHRQRLRDLPSVTQDPRSPVWPELTLSTRA